MPSVHDPRRGRRREVAARRRSSWPVVDGARVVQRALSLLRRGDRLLAGDRDRQAAGTPGRRDRPAGLDPRATTRRRARRRRSPGRSASCSRRAPRSGRSSCVFDDVHWGEPAFLDLVEHVADLSRDAPILLLCMARPELLDVRPAWGGGKLNATNVLLEPLAPDETGELIDRARGRASRTGSAAGSSKPPAGTRSSSRRWSRWRPRATPR